jgi:broad-specificity NMP kinase
VPAYLVTGNPGSGKSTLAAELARRGLRALDADDLASWEDAAGRRVDRPIDAPAGWELDHQWVWSRDRLESAVAAGAVYVCGIARNLASMLDLFDRVFLLMIDAETQEARLTTPDRSDTARQQTREGRDGFQKAMLALGAIPLDGTASPGSIADQLLAVE